MLLQKPQTKRFLTAADRFLRDRNFSDCRAVALRARDSDPSNPGPNRILAITTALSAAPRDYYAVFGLPQFESDDSLIRSTFRTLASNLNPNVNPYPIAAEALDVVLKAWSVLSNPTKKAAFDEDLRRSFPASDVGGNPAPPGGSPVPPGGSPAPPGGSPDPLGGSRAPPGGTFWTICPYCYHVYEYDVVYEDCSLRCSNEKCRKVLHAFPIQAPPSGEVEKGHYWCMGFMPLEISGSNGEKLGEKPWAPFGPRDENLSCNGEDVIVDISDKERARTNGKRQELHEDVLVDISDKESAKTNDKRRELQEEVMVDISDKERANTNDKRRELQEEAVVDISDKERDETNCKRRKMDVGVNTEIKDSNGVRVKRKKSVPWNSKKTMGRGVVIDENWAGLVYGADEEKAGNLNGSGLETAFGSEQNNGGVL